MNIGVSILDADAAEREIDPWYLGSLDENTVQGYAGTPVDVNELTYDYLLPVGAAGASFPRQGQYYVAVDSGARRFTDKRARGRVRAALVGERRDAAVGPAADDARVRRDARRSSSERSTRSRASTRSRSRSATRGSSSPPSAYDPDTGLAVFPLPRERTRPPRRDDEHRA